MKNNDSKFNQKPVPLIDNTPIERFDKAHTKGGQVHVHFKKGGALNKDGSWKDKPEIKIDNKTKEYLKQNGWNFNK